MVIKPTQDGVLAAGVATTISDQHDNIHWFKALTGPVFMFNTGIFKLDPTKDFTGRDYIDLVGGEKLSDGTIQVRRIEQR